MSALAAALCDWPETLRVSWCDGVRGRPEPCEVTPAGFVGDLRHHIGETHPKHGGPMLVPAALADGATRATDAAARAVTFAVCDHDDGAVTLGDAWRALYAAGVGAVLYPTPSEPLGPRDGAQRWRALVPLAADTSPELYVRHAHALRLALEALIGERLDATTWGPSAKAFVSPRPEVGARTPDAVVVCSGLAVDLRALGEAAALAGWWTPREADAGADARRAGVRDGAALVALLEAAGYVTGSADRRGWAPLRCPRELWHGARGDARRDTSAMVNLHTGAVKCHHDHSGAPTDADRGPAGSSRVLAWLRADHPELAPAIAAVRDARGVGLVAEELASPPPGEAPRRVVHAAGVEREVGDALALAHRTERLVLHTPTVGAGKSRGIGAAVVRALRDGTLHPAEDASAPKASAAVAVRTRADLRDVALSILRAAREAGVDLAVGVHTPVHEILRADGSHACEFHVDARALYERGASARGSLCGAVPTPVGPRPCPLREGCIARDPWVQWSESGSTPRPLPVGVPWVAVVVHQSAAAVVERLRVGAVFVVDEADDALRPTHEEFPAASLDAAVGWAARLERVRSRADGSADTDAPRCVSEVIARAARAAGPEALAAMAPDARRAWCIDLVHRALDGDVQARRWCERWVDAAGDDLAAAVVAKWTRCNVSAVRWLDAAAPLGAHRRGLSSLPEHGREALTGLQRWALGCHARVLPTDDGPALSLSWRTESADVARAVLERRGGVLALDATGTPALAAAAVEPFGCDHDPVRVDGGADVRRVLVHAGGAGRTALMPKGGVQWARAAEMLTAATGALRAAQRDGYGVGPGLVVTGRPLALALAVLTASPDASAETLRGMLMERLEGAKNRPGERALARILGALDAVTPDARDAARELAAVAPDVAWVWWGSAGARGSNAHRERAWCITLGDGRPSLESARSELWTRTGETPSDDAVRAAMDATASKAHTQAHGRLRAVQRQGARLLMVHVGRVAPEDWYGLPVGQRPTVVAPATARRWGAASAVPASPVVAAVEAAVADAVEPPSADAHEALRAAAAAGWTLADVRVATGAATNTARAWWRGERHPPPGAVERLRALADGRDAPTLRMTLRALSSGRGWAVLWNGSRGAEGIGARLVGAGLQRTVGSLRERVHRWVEVPDAPLPDDVVAALAGLLPALAAVFPAVRPLPAPALSAIAREALARAHAPTPPTPPAAPAAAPTAPSIHARPGPATVGRMVAPRVRYLPPVVADAPPPPAAGVTARHGPSPPRPRSG